MLSHQRFLPGCRPVYGYALPVPKYTSPSSRVNRGIDQIERAADDASAGFAHVRMYGSCVGSGVVQNRHTSLPVLALYASR